MIPAPRKAVSPITSLVAALALGSGAALADLYEPPAFNASELTVAQAYIAYYGRAADPGGLAYWSQRLEEEGGNLGSIIQAFGNSEEFNQRFGSLGTEALIRNLYHQLFNREPDPGGLAFYSAELSAGRKTLQTIALDVLYGATGGDQAIIANKVAVSQFVTGTIASAPGAAVGDLDVDAMAELVARVGEDDRSLASLYCQARSVIYGETPGALDGRSPAQLAFISARGYPDIFSLSFTTEGVDENGRLVRLDVPTRRDSWVYNGSTFVSAWFENGYFVSETTHGYGVDLVPTNLRPDQFQLCMNEQEVVDLIGIPNCEEGYDLGGPSEYRIWRYDPTVGRPTVSVALEDGLVIAVTAGYALTDSSASSQSPCE